MSEGMSFAGNVNVCEDESVSRFFAPPFLP